MAEPMIDLRCDACGRLQVGPAGAAGERCARVDFGSWGGRVASARQCPGTMRDLRGGGAADDELTRELNQLGILKTCERLHMHGLLDEWERDNLEWQRGALDWLRARLKRWTPSTSPYDAAVRVLMLETIAEVEHRLERAR